MIILLAEKATELLIFLFYFFILVLFLVRVYVHACTCTCTCTSRWIKKTGTLNPSIGTLPLGHFIIIIIKGARRMFVWFCLSSRVCQLLEHSPQTHGKHCCSIKTDRVNQVTLHHHASQCSQVYTSHYRVQCCVLHQDHPGGYVLLTTLECSR